MFRDAVGHYSCARLNACSVALDDHRANGDGGVYVAREIYVANSTGVWTSGCGFQIVYDLHRPHFRRARDGACRQHSLEHIHSVAPLDQLPGHLRGHVHYMAVSLQSHQLVQVESREIYHAADVVAGEIHQHDMLGPLFGMLRQLRCQSSIVCCRLASATSARDGARDDRAVAHLHQRLGRRADEGDFGQSQIVHVRAGIDLAQDPIHIQRFCIQIEVKTL